MSYKVKIIVFQQKGKEFMASTYLVMIRYCSLMGKELVSGEIIMGFCCWIPSCRHLSASQMMLSSWSYYFQR